MDKSPSIDPSVQAVRTFASIDSVIVGHVFATPLQNSSYEQILYYSTTCFQQLFVLDNSCFDGTTRFLVVVFVIAIVIVIVIETITKTKKPEGRPK